MKEIKEIIVPPGFSLTDEGLRTPAWLRADKDVVCLWYDEDDAFIGSIPAEELTQEWVDKVAANLISKKNLAQQRAGVRP